MPRARPNTRVKDLPDIALLATTGALEASRLRLALERTFGFRATHLLPSSLPEPSNDWSLPYREMARENELVWTTLEELSIAAKGFLDPILAKKRGIWDPTKWVWREANVPERDTTQTDRSALLAGPEFIRHLGRDGIQKWATHEVRLLLLKFLGIAHRKLRSGVV